MYYLSILLVHLFNVADNNKTEPEHWYRELRKIKKLSKIFSNTERRKLCSVRDSSLITTAVNERGEGTVVAGWAYLFRVLDFHFMTAFQTQPKKVFPFPNNYRRPIKILTTLLLTFFSTFSIRPSIFFLFSYSCNAFPYFFSTFTIRPFISSLLHSPTRHEGRRFAVRIG